MTITVDPFWLGVCIGWLLGKATMVGMIVWIVARHKRKLQETIDKTSNLV